MTTYTDARDHITDPERGSTALGVENQLKMLDQMHAMAIVNNVRLYMQVASHQLEGELMRAQLAIRFCLYDRVLDDAPIGCGPNFTHRVVYMDLSTSFPHVLASCRSPKCHDNMAWADLGIEKGPWRMTDNHGRGLQKSWEATDPGWIAWIADLPPEDVKGYAYPPGAVVEGIRKAFGNTGKVEQILAQTKYDHLNGCWSVNWMGMYVGIEADGHVHT